MDKDKYLKMLYFLHGNTISRVYSDEIFNFEYTPLEMEKDGYMIFVDSEKTHTMEFTKKFYDEILIDK